jgi:hypothetical protein
MSPAGSIGMGVDHEITLSGALILRVLRYLATAYKIVQSALGVIETRRSHASCGTVTSTSS